MKKSYRIPLYDIKGGSNKETLERSIKILSKQYLVDWEFMDSVARIELLECIVNLTNIYFNMGLEEEK